MKSGCHEIAMKLLDMNLSMKVLSLMHLEIHAKFIIEKFGSDVSFDELHIKGSRGIM